MGFGGQRPGTHVYTSLLRMEPFQPYTWGLCLKNPGCACFCVPGFVTWRRRTAWYTVCLSDDAIFVKLSHAAAYISGCMEQQLNGCDHQSACGELCVPVLVSTWSCCQLHIMPAAASVLASRCVLGQLESNAFPPLKLRSHKLHGICPLGGSLARSSCISFNQGSPAFAHPPPRKRQTQAPLLPLQYRIDPIRAAVVAAALGLYTISTVVAAAAAVPSCPRPNGPVASALDTGLLGFAWALHNQAVLDAALHTRRW